MSAPAFTLSVPAEQPFRGLAVEAVRVYLKARGGGGSPVDEAFVALVAEALDRLAASGAEIDLVVEASPAAIDVQLACGAAAETLTHALPAAGG